MSKYSKNKIVSDSTKEEASKIARANQKPGQTKDQTKLIAQGIQKGIEQYKRKYNKKVRELDKKHNQEKTKKIITEQSTDREAKPEKVQQNKLPWILLVLSWLGFLTYIITRAVVNI